MQRPAPKVVEPLPSKNVKLTQNERILEYLMKGGTLTHVTALGLFSCARLAARIDDLRNMGHNIITENVKQNGKTFARYHLAKGK